MWPAWDIQNRETVWQIDIIESNKCFHRLAAEYGYIQTYQ